jgi:ribulose bisphosphate carboxylase small subunit
MDSGYTLGTYLGEFADSKAVWKQINEFSKEYNSHYVRVAEISPTINLIDVGSHYRFYAMVKI